VPGRVAAAVSTQVGAQCRRSRLTYALQGALDQGEEGGCRRDGMMAASCQGGEGLGSHLWALSHPAAALFAPFTAGPSPSGA
jgi:hypothetical protein